MRPGHITFGKKCSGVRAGEDIVATVPLSQKNVRLTHTLEKRQKSRNLNDGLNRQVSTPRLLSRGVKLCIFSARCGADTRILTGLTLTSVTNIMTKSKLVKVKQ